jgi:Spy/CpxP family protein refolding chaperone
MSTVFKSVSAEAFRDPKIKRNCSMKKLVLSLAAFSVIAAAATTASAHPHWHHHIWHHHHWRHHHWH